MASAAPDDYDCELCLIPQSLVRFLQVTQPQAWRALRTELGDEAESRIVKRVRNVIEKKGTRHQGTPISKPRRRPRS